VLARERHDVSEADLRRVAILCFLILISAFGGDYSRACSCIRPPLTVDNILTRDIVFAGIAVQLNEYKYKNVFLFKVKRVWKGTPRKMIMVATDRYGGACGMPFKIGEKYLVVAKDGQTFRYTASSCGLTCGYPKDPSSRVAAVIEELGEPIVEYILDDTPYKW